MPDCGLRVFDGAGRLARELRVQVPDTLDPPTLERIHRQCIAGVTCSYAVLDQGWTVRALYLHHQLLPREAVITGVRRRSPGRWITASCELGPLGGGRGACGPDIFFRQAELDAERAWLAPLLLRLGQRLSTRTRTLGENPLWTWQLRAERYFYWETPRRWQLLGGGNTPLLRLEQAVHLADPASVEEYLWAVGAVPLGPHPYRVATTSSSRPTSS